MSSSFKLAQVVAAIEKLDTSANTVFRSNSISAMASSAEALMQLIKEDPVLDYIDNLIMANVQCDVDSWLEQYAKLRSSFVGSGIYSLGKTRSQRYCIVKKLFEKIMTDVENFEKFILGPAHSWYGSGNIPSIAMQFLVDFLGALYRDLRNSLVDLRVEAELSDNKEISKQTIVNIVFNGSVQNVQAENIKKTDIIQNQ